MKFHNIIQIIYKLIFGGGNLLIINHIQHIKLDIFISRQHGF